MKGEVDKYTWRSMGSSFVMSELCAALLSAQLEDLDVVTTSKRAIWSTYKEALMPYSQSGKINIPEPIDADGHNGHLFYIEFQADLRGKFIERQKQLGIACASHYVSLHAAPFAFEHEIADGRAIPFTEKAAARLVRLPSWVGLENDQGQVIDAVRQFLDEI